MREINNIKIPYQLPLTVGDKIAIITNLVPGRHVGIIITINIQEVHLYVEAHPDKSIYCIFPRNQVVIEILEKYDTGKLIYPKEEKEE